MNIFWLMVAGVVVVVACAYLFVVLPQLRKKRTDSGMAPKGMAVMLAGKNAPAVVIAVAIPLIAIALYLAWGSKPGVPASDASSKAKNAQMAPEHIEMIKALAARLEKNPDDGKGWAMLARTYATMGRFPEAAASYEKAANLIQNDAKLLTDYADVLAMANGRSLQGKPLELIHSALKIDPSNTKGLFLIGKAAYQAGDFTHAVGYWEKLLQSLPPDSPLAKQISDDIAKAREQIK